jgi:hypothetical protein
MSKVLTWEEYEALDKDRLVQPISHIEEKVQEEVIPIPAQTSTEYYLMFPDNPIDNYHNGIYHIDQDNTLEIVNGIVVTESLEIKDKLVKQGFLFLQQKVKEEE